MPGDKTLMSLHPVYLGVPVIFGVPGVVALGVPGRVPLEVPDGSTFTVFCPNSLSPNT